MKCGNIRKEDLKDIWEKSAGMKFVRMLSDENFYFCKDCEAKSLCEFCIGFNCLVNGNIFYPYKWTCEFSKKFYNYLKKRKGEFAKPYQRERR